MSSEQSKVYRIKQDNVKKALELFSNVKKTKKRTKSGKDEEKTKSFYCNPIFSNNQKKSTALAYLPSFAMTEMRLCLMKHDWINLQRLFPILLELSSERETLIWRYAFTIMLHSPMSSREHLEKFFNECVGCRVDNYDYVLEQLITLESKNDREKKKLLMVNNL